MHKRILLVDPDPAERAALSARLVACGREARAAETAAEAIAGISGGQIDLCIASLDPSVDGAAVLAAARAQQPEVPLVALTPDDSARTAVAAVRAGASDFVAKPAPVTALADLFTRLSGAPDSARSARRPRATLVGEHPSMRLVLERIGQIADTDASVLVRGETGTGKEVVARLIHATSERRGGPFVSVHMAAIPQALAEAELFGHAEGAFTGADRPRQGRVLAAEKGTLFLDGIGDMPLPLQGKLLRVLQEREVTPIGGSPTPFDVRIIAATHRNLEQMVREGTFREDLFYRLDVIPIDVPPLRDRRADIALLADHFRREMNGRERATVPAFSPELVAALASYEWPGNVRQLENTVERLVVIARSRAVTTADLPNQFRGEAVNMNATLPDLPPSGVDLRSLLTQLEDRLIAQALARTGGNRNRAAELLGLNRTTLVEKLRRRSVA